MSDNPEVKIIGGGVLAGLLFFIALAVYCVFLHSNDVEDVQVLQSVTGKITINRDGGYYLMAWPDKWTYEKRCLEICSKEGDGDAPKMQFANTSTGYLNCQVGYSIADATDEQILAIHQYAQGNVEKLWQKVWTKIQTKAQIVASRYTPVDVVKNFTQFNAELNREIIHEPTLLKEGIDITFFDCAGLPTFDDDTKRQLDKQKTADLAKRNAEAEKIQLEAEKLRTVAQYERDMAEQEGKAKAEMAKQVQEAEKAKKLAEIEAQKKLEVEKLEKEQMLVKISKEKEVAELAAQKELSVAEIAKKTETANLDVIKLQAEQKIATANAKQKEIELSGAITEQERVRLEIEKETRVKVAEAYAEGISKVKLPQMWMSGGSKDGAAASPIDVLISMLALEKVNSMGTAQSAVPVVSAPLTETKTNPKTKK